MPKPRILVITAIDSIKGVREMLEKTGRVTVWPNPSYKQVLEAIPSYDAIFTSPNNTKVFMSGEMFERAKKLKAVCSNCQKKLGDEINKI